MLRGTVTTEAFLEEALLSWARGGCWPWSPPLWPGSWGPGLPPGPFAHAFLEPRGSLLATTGHPVANFQVGVYRLGIPTCVPGLLGSPALSLSLSSH